jgi:hypothetical protein
VLIKELADAVYDMATCYGEEPQCWFVLSFFADELGVDNYDIEDALGYLQVHDRLHVRYAANGGVHVHQPESCS